jgi:hypothetical protein
MKSWFVSDPCNDKDVASIGVSFHKDPNHKPLVIRSIGVSFHKDPKYIK